MFTVIILAGALFAATMIGLLVLIRVGMTREQDRYLANDAPTRLAGLTRSIAGLHVRMPERDVRVLSPADPAVDPARSHNAAPSPSSSIGTAP